MPNHITTICKIVGEQADIEKFCETHLVQDPESGNRFLDFNTVIPMPEILRDLSEGSDAEMGAELITWRGSSCAPLADRGSLYSVHYIRIRENLGLQKADISEVATTYLAKNPNVEKAGRDRLKAILETGYASWYPWSIANWETKWNSYSFDIVSDSPLVIKFNTAWAFPTPVFKKLAELWPGLNFECDCYDEGSNFAGEGFFNPSEGQMSFEITDATPEIYERVYGHPQPVYED